MLLSKGESPQDKNEHPQEVKMTRNGSVTKALENSNMLAHDKNSVARERTFTGTIWDNANEKETSNNADLSNGDTVL